MNTEKPAGWYEDASDPNLLRYWDGEVRTDLTKPVNACVQQPMAPSARRAIIGIVVAVVVALAVCIALGVTSFTSGSTDSSSDAPSLSSISRPTADNNAKKSTTKKYTAKAAGLTISLPSEWVVQDADELWGLAKVDYDSIFSFQYNSDQNGEVITCCIFPGFEGVKISDYTKKSWSDFYSQDADWSVKSVKKKKLKSGTYYVTECTLTDASGIETSFVGQYTVYYDTVKNGHQVRFIYSSVGGKSDTPHLSDFEKMVKNAKYK